MRKKALAVILSLSAIAFAISGCTKDSAEEKILSITSNSYIAESMSGDVVVNFDKEGNPIELIDANGDVIDLGTDGVKVNKNSSGEIVSVVTEKGETLRVKEKANEKNSSEIIAKAETKLAEEKKSDTQEKKSETAKVSEEKKEEVVKTEADGTKTKYVDLEQEEKKTENKSEKTSEVKVAKKDSEAKADTRSEESKTKTVAEEVQTGVPGEVVTPINKTMYAKATRNGMHKVYSDTTGETVISSIVPGILEALRIQGDRKSVDGAITVSAQTNTDWYKISFNKGGQTINGWIPIYSLTDVAPSVVDSAPTQADQKTQSTPQQQTQPGENSSQQAQQQTTPSAQAMQIPADAVQGADYEGHAAYYTYSARTCPEHLAQVNAIRAENDIPAATWNSGQESAAMNRLLELVKAGQPLNHGYGNMFAGGENLAVGGGDYVGAYCQSAGHKATLLADYRDGDLNPCTSMVSVCVTTVVYVPDLNYTETRKDANNAMMFFN